MGAAKSKFKTVHLEGVGAVRLERSRRAKNICLSVRPFKGIRIAVPWHVSYAEALEVAREKADWLSKHQALAERAEAEASDFNRLAPINRTVARNIIVDRLNDLADTYGFKYKKVFVRSQKTRWGSCSGCNNINLNVNLIRLPADLMDYVILHELVHTRIKDHSPAFWRMLEQYVPDARKVDRQLDQYGPMLISQANSR